MCGGCRVSVDGKSQFACVDGPEFDAHQVDFQNLREPQRDVPRDGSTLAAGVPRPPGAGSRARPGPRVPPAGPGRTSRPAGQRAHTESRRMSGRLTPKERVKIPRQRMPEQEPASRRHNFQEVNLGLAASLAATEASRCIACADPKCVKGCPVGVKVREFVELVAQGDYKAAAAKMREDNVLPAVTGRVCPQEDQCEGACVMGKKFDPLAIGHLERFVADWEADSGELGLPPRAPAHRQEGRLRRQRPGRAHRGGRPGAEGPRGHGVRGAARGRRRAGLRHPGVPPAEGHRAPRDREPGEDGRALRDQRRRRAHRHDRRAAAAGGLRRRLRRHRRRPAEVPRASRART